MTSNSRDEATAEEPARVTTLGGLSEADCQSLLEQEMKGLVLSAIAEDVGEGDWTTLWTVGADLRCDGAVVSKESLVLSGVRVAEMVFREVDPGLEVERPVVEGERVGSGTEVLRVRGSARSILTAERAALNFMGRLSGIATQTRRFVDEVEGTGAQITDTRKTTPGWRHLEKRAVRQGGATNHRSGLYDMVLVKDNHIVAAGGVVEAVRRVAALNQVGLPVEVEVTQVAQLHDLQDCAVDRILLDNMTNEELRESVEVVANWSEARPELEASGNMTIERVRSVAETGVQWISVGALTHSVMTVDLSLRLWNEASAPSVQDSGEAGRAGEASRG